MDATRFEALLQLLSTMPSRRGVARTALGLALAGPLGGRLDLAPAEAKKRKKKCKKQTPCICPPQCSENADCPADSGKICEAGSCICAPGEFDSGGVCGSFPGCAGRAVSCGSDGDCCSNDCTGTGCFCSAVGQPCIVDEDCCLAEPPVPCRGFVCSNP